MTSDRPDRADEPRDPLVDAAWRAASREEPPPALDDAIRAAARREAGAGPTRAATDVPEATSPERWWWPLAAAATIGAIALGLIQVIGTSPTETQRLDRTVASDMPNGLAGRAPATPGAAPATDAVQSAQPTTPPEPADARAERSSEAPMPGAAKRAQPAAAAQTAAAPPAPLPGPPAPTSPLPTEKVAAVTAPAATPAAAEASSASRAPTPFPAAPDVRTSDGDTRPSASAAAEQVARARRDEATVQAQGAMRSAAPAGATTTAGLQSEAGAPADARPRLPVTEWVALIRRLRDEGRIDEAAKELAAFRAAYADHERQLPPDLRDWKPPPTR